MLPGARVDRGVLITVPIAVYAFDHGGSMAEERL